MAFGKPAGQVQPGLMMPAGAIPVQVGGTFGTVAGTVVVVPDDATRGAQAFYVTDILITNNATVVATVTVAGSVGPGAPLVNWATVNPSIPTIVGATTSVKISMVTPIPFGPGPITVVTTSVAGGSAVVTIVGGAGQQ